MRYAIYGVNRVSKDFLYIFKDIEVSCFFEDIVIRDRPAAIFKFNEFFKKDLKVSQEDYIDIYEVESAEQVLEQLAKPIPFCRYCKLEGRNKDYEWGVSEHIIEEYI